MPIERKSPAGRKPIITPELVSAIENALLTGMSQVGVCDFVGITQETYYRWLRISEGIKADGEHPEMPKPPRRRKDDTDTTFNARMAEYEQQMVLLASFSERVKKSLSSVEMLMLNAIMEAINPPPPAQDEPPRQPNWTAAAWYLERVHWRTYGRRTIGNEDDGSINLNITLNKVKKDANKS